MSATYPLIKNVGAIKFNFFSHPKLTFSTFEIKPVAQAIKLFTLVIYDIQHFSTIHFHTSLVFAVKAGANQSGASYKTPL